MCAGYIRAFFDAEGGQRNAIHAFDDALKRLRHSDSRRAHTRAQIAMFKGKLHQKTGDLAKAESELNEACSLDPHNVHMKVCLLRILQPIIKAAKSARNEQAALSAAHRAAEVAQAILTYDSQQKDALYAVEDLYRTFGIQ